MKRRGKDKAVNTNMEVSVVQTPDRTSAVSKTKLRFMSVSA